MASQGEACRGCATAAVLRDRIAELERRNVDLVLIINNYRAKLGLGPYPNNTSELDEIERDVFKFK